jgi:hypothetical protein
MEKKGYEADLQATAKAVLNKGLILKRHCKVPGEKDPAKAIRLTEVKATKKEPIEAKTAESTTATLAYDIFCKLPKDNPEIQWDRIVVDMHSKNPWLILRVLNITDSAKNRINP